MTYRCGTCGHTDPDAFYRCSHPGCPDGRDQNREWKYYEMVKATPFDWSSLIVVCSIALILIALMIGMGFALTRPAHAKDHGFQKDTVRSQWFASLMRPDFVCNPKDMRSCSCCGEADAYEADKFEMDGEHAMWVTVTGGGAITYPDGMKRTPIPDGTRVWIPLTKVNPLDPDQVTNPTEHGWIFLSVYEDSDGSFKVGNVFCYIKPPAKS